MTTLRTTHNAGFFSCCSVKLDNITKFYNIHRTLPYAVDSSAQFQWYKQPGEGDVTYKYFEHPDLVPTPIPSLSATNPSIPYHHVYQFLAYDRLNYSLIVPFVKKYFSPSLEIQQMIQHLEEKYHLDYSNLCVLFYRGNDKVTETPLCSYEEYLIYAKNILEKQPQMRFLIQSDETEFIHFMEDHLPHSVVFYDEIRHMPKQNSTVDILMKDNIEHFSKYYLAITIVMAKCKYVVCGSGNCSIWIMFYREHCKGLFQNLLGKWLVTPTE
jgi:hypothetical protein